MGKTSIEWTDHSWPVVNGCRRISPGCGGASGVGGCYAERLTATRLRHMPKYQGLAKFTEHGPRWTGETRLWEPDLDMPLRLRKPGKIFVADMGDLFYEGVPDEVIDRVWATMLLAPRHVFQVLTKRPERMRAYLEAPGLYERVLRAAGPIREKRPELTSVGISNPATHPARWIWLGVSVENQDYMGRVDELQKTPAAVRFVSAEPLLGPLDFGTRLSCCERTDTTGILRDAGGRHVKCNQHCGISWVIVGGESGNGARPFDIAWGRSIVEQCRAAGTPVFTKQLGSNPTEGYRDPRNYGPLIRLKSRKGGDPNEWPPGDWPREFPR